MRKLTPEIHDIAFSYRDYGNEVDCIEYNWHKHSDAESQAILDITCGTGIHLEHFCSRGYECVGMDSNPTMIRYCKEKFADIDKNAKFYENGCVNFDHNRKFGLAINMLTSANLILTNEHMITHLRSVAKALEPGGIYFLEMSHPREYSYNANIPTRSWEITRDNMLVRVETKFEGEQIDPMVQIQQSSVVVSIIKEDKEEVYCSPEIQRIYLYLELLSLIQNAGGFELVACYGTFNSSVEMDSSRRSWRMIPVLKRTEEVIE